MITIIYNYCFNHKFFFFAFCFIFITHSLLSQDEGCHLVKSASENIYTVDSFDLECLARSSEKAKVLIFTFGTWCKPCRYHLPDAIQLAKGYNLDLYILLTDEENSQREAKAITYLDQIKVSHDCEFEVFILKDENGDQDKKYKQFLKNITPSQFENIGGMSKYIIIDKSGEVLLVTNWKDRQGTHWKDNSKKMNKIISVLQN